MTNPDIDAALSRLQAVLRPRVGKKMTALVMKNLVGLIEQKIPEDTLRHTIQQHLDAYARIPESGTPFPLPIAKAIGDAGCVNLAVLARRLRWQEPAAISMSQDEARGVAQHADALLPSYGDDDAEFAVRVAWRCSHQFRLHLVVGRAFNRNDATATTMLHEAWRAHGSPDRCAPIGVVEAAMGTPGVIYAIGPSTSDVLTRFVASAFVFSPDHGDNIHLDDIAGLQRFVAQVPLAITPQTLAWLCHLVRIATGAAIALEDETLLGDWEAKEEVSSSAASILLGIASPRLEERASITILAGEACFTYQRGELSLR